MSELQNVCNFTYKDEIHHGAKISDVIAKLQQIQQQYGDLDLYVIEGDRFFDDFLSIDALKVAQVTYSDKDDYRKVIATQTVLTIEN